MERNHINQDICYKLRSVFFALIIVALASMPNMAKAGTAEDLKKDADHALQMITSSNPVAKKLADKAQAVLIFPNIIKAGFMLGGAYGEGVLKQNGVFDGYYNSLGVSFGFQAGAQSYGYILFLMDAAAVEYLHETNGWEIGVGPTVVVVNEGIAKNLSTSTLKDDVYAFIFDQQGLMAGVSIEGNKITKINKQ
jgi:lipid-binding SYLF domain-containing protein